MNSQQGGGGGGLDKAKVGVWTWRANVRLFDKLGFGRPKAGKPGLDCGRVSFARQPSRLQGSGQELEDQNCKLLIFINITRSLEAPPGPDVFFLLDFF